MAAIACPDCGQKVSSLAETCPHCARPNPALSAADLQKKKTAEASAKAGEEFGNVIGCIGLLWIANAVLAGMSKGVMGFILSLMVGPLIWLMR